MAKLIFITGGQRSGKSSYAQALAEKKSNSPLYLATAKIWDSEFKKRVERHQNDRGDQWTTIEEEVHISKLDLNNKTVLLDCITLWLTNIFHQNDYEIEPSLEFAKKEWNALLQQNCNLIVVSNEIGMGVIPMDASTRKFVDLQGWMNQHIATTAEEVIMMVSGIAVPIK